MAIKIAANLKKEMLESWEIYGVTHGDDPYHYSEVSVTPTYGVTGNQAYLEVSNVTLPVNSNTTVDTIYLWGGTGSNSTVMATITLEGNEIHTYDVNGTYTINNLRISF